ncbi:signal recognition particle protein [Candidatus Woesearchaeota archaeon]|nr:signal recognition particle protein [Candidatus Woesearchaeota archaeon]|tara:strand:+ start:5899 stop:7254 length:1356 start_codon:yes stop_codon:yes gene_type:complete
MVLDKLGESLKNTLQKVAKSVFVDDRLINELVKDIQRALLQSDVNVQLVFKLSKDIKERALKEEVPSGITQKEHLIKIVYDELVKFLGEKESEIKTDKKNTKIMLLGLFGSGKTTTAGKLARYFQKRGLKLALVQLDVYRPAAFEQLKQLGEQINVPVFGDKKEKNPLKIYNSVKKELSKFDVVIIDTAGRDALSNALIKELKELGKKIQPEESLLVMSADIGQAAQKQAEAFHEAKTITGVIVTKLEGTAKGGGALTSCAATGAKVKFIGIGEKTEDLERFVPERFVGRLLGMGDLDTLLEKANEAISEEEAQDMGKKFLKGDFNLLDLYEQMQTMKKMGSLSKIVEMVPGFGQLKLPKEMLDVQEGKLQKWKIAMASMSKKELENPEIIDSERIDRISKGSGIPASEIRELIKQHKQSKKMVKMFKGGSPKQMEKMMKKMGGMKGLKMK